MPIVVQHNPVGLLGDLATNAGAYATQQQTNDQGFRQQQLYDTEQGQANQFALGQQQHDLEAQRNVAQQQQTAASLYQQAQYHAQQLAAIHDKLGVTAALGQGKLDAQQGHYADQGDHWQNQDATGQQRAVTGQQRADTYQQATDQTGDYQDGRIDQGQQQIDQRGDYEQGLLGNAKQRLDAYEQSLADRATNGNSAASFALRTQAEARIAGNQQYQQARGYMTTLMAQEQHLVKLADPNNLNVDDATRTTAQQQLQENRAEQARVAPVYRQMAQQAFQTVAPAAGAASPMAQPGRPAPAAAPSAAASPAISQASVDQLVGEGYSDDQIRQMLGAR